MWTLRKSSEINQVICIPIKETFTIGRIECSYNITDDKSVSRRHATISFSDPFNPILTDCASKFGTFINGNRVTTTCKINNGDLIKFGGATSEFVAEYKDFSVSFKSKETFGKLKDLMDKFGIELKSCEDAIYFVIEDDDKIEFDRKDFKLVASALLLAKFIVSPSYFTQLRENSSKFSLGLIQPAIQSKSFPMDCWLPKRERFNLFKNSFDGISRFVILDQSVFDISTIELISKLFKIELKHLSDESYSNLKFNELLVISKKSNPIDASTLTDPIRIIEIESIWDTLIKVDKSLLKIDVIYPEKRVNEMKQVTNIERDVKLAVERDVKPHVKHPDVRHPVVKPDIIVNPDVTTTQIIQEQVDYKGPSLTTVIPIPPNLLRPRQSPTLTNDPPKPSKFVKCHPKHRQPGIIPALIGPDQLQPLHPSTNTVPATNSVKRRALVKDCWLEEDDFKTEEVKKDPVEEIPVEKMQKSEEIPVAKIQKSEEIPAVKIQKPSESPLPSKENTNNPQTNSTTSSTGSKFQSSFFKNFSKGK